MTRNSHTLGIILDCFSHEYRYQVRTILERREREVQLDVSSPLDNKAHSGKKTLNGVNAIKGETILLIRSPPF